MRWSVHGTDRFGSVPRLVPLDLARGTRFKGQPQPKGAGDFQQCCQRGVAVFRQRLLEVAPI